MPGKPGDGHVSKAIPLPLLLPTCAQAERRRKPERKRKRDRTWGPPTRSPTTLRESPVALFRSVPDLR